MQVTVTRAQWSIDPMTLLTRVGGVVGVGKELLWLVLLLTTATITTCARAKQCLPAHREGYSGNEIQ